MNKEQISQDQTKDQMRTNHQKEFSARKQQKNKSMFSKKCKCRMNEGTVNNNQEDVCQSQNSNDSSSSHRSSKNDCQKNEFNLGDSFSKAFFNFFPEGVAFIDSSMNLLYANDSLYKQFQSDQFDLLEKVFQLKNELEVNELSKQKSQKAQNFIMNNIVRTDQHIQTPKINNNYSLKMKSFSNIIQQDLPQVSRKFSGVPFKANQSQNNMGISNQSNTQIGAQSLNVQSTSNKAQNSLGNQINQTNIKNYVNGNSQTPSNNNNNNNHEGSLNQISQFANYILQSNCNTPNTRQKSNTTFPLGILNRNTSIQNNSNMQSLSGQQSYRQQGSKKNIYDEQQLMPQFSQYNKFSYNQSTLTNEECIFNCHYPVQDSVNHINIQKKQAISPDLKQEIQTILSEAQLYLQLNSIEADCILDKSFTFTSRIVFNNNNNNNYNNNNINNNNDIQKRISISQQGTFSSNQINQTIHQQQNAMLKEKKVSISEKLNREDSFQSKQFSQEQNIILQQSNTQIQQLQKRKSSFNSQHQQNQVNYPIQLSKQNQINQHSLLNQINHANQFNLVDQVSRGNINQTYQQLQSLNNQNSLEQNMLNQQASLLDNTQSNLIQDQIPQIMNSHLFQKQEKIINNNNNNNKTGNGISEKYVNGISEKYVNGFEQIELKAISSCQEGEELCLKSESINRAQHNQNEQDDDDDDEDEDDDDTIYKIDLDDSPNHIYNLDSIESPKNIPNSIDSPYHFDSPDDIDSPNSNYNPKLIDRGQEEKSNFNLTDIPNVYQKSYCNIKNQLQNNLTQQLTTQNLNDFAKKSSLRPYSSEVLNYKSQQQQKQQYQQLSEQHQQSGNNQGKMQGEILQNGLGVQDQSKACYSPNWISTSNNNTSITFNNNNSMNQKISYAKSTPVSPPIVGLGNSSVNDADLIKFSNQSRSNLQDSHINDSQNIQFKMPSLQKSDKQSSLISNNNNTRVNFQNQKQRYSNNYTSEHQEKGEKNQDLEWNDGEMGKNTREVDITIFTYIINKTPVILILVRDVTHRSYIKLLQDVSKKKSKMVSFVSHELRTPLNSIIAMLETMKNKPDIDYIETALMNSKYLLCISNDLLDLAQIQVNKFQIRKKTFNLKELIVEVMQMFQIQAERQSIELIVDYSPEIRQYVTSDKNRIRQVLINLIGNAFKFTLTGSINIKVEKINNVLFEVIVSDTGIGIKEGDLNKLFKTFGKLDGEESVKMNEQGVGLGLVISNMIAFSLSEENEGLTVKSEYSKGTNFKFKLLDWNMGQSQIYEDQLGNRILEEQEEVQMCVIAEEDEDNQILKNIQQYKTFTLSNNKFTEEKVAKRKKDKQPTIISPSESLKSPIKNKRSSNRPLSPLKQSNTLIVQSLNQTPERNPIRLLTDFQITWKEERKNRLQLQKIGGPKDYNLLTYNGNTSTKIDYNYPTNKLTKIATQINIKDQWGSILIVDDNMSNILAMKCLINSINPDLICNYAIRGQGAEDLVQNRFNQQKDVGYSIIFMDIVMPEQDGITTSRRIKQYLNENNIVHTKIIACSGYDDEYEKRKCLEVGMIDYLVKPVFKDKLASVIHTYLK